MSHLVTLNGYLSLGGTVVSTDTASMNTTHGVDLIDDNNFGDLWHQRVIGAQDFQMAFEASNDLVDDALDEDIEALIATNFAVAMRHDGGAISASNPEYQFTGSFSSIQKTFQWNTLAKISGTIMLTTSAGVTRDITP